MINWEKNTFNSLSGQIYFQIFTCTNSRMFSLSISMFLGLGETNEKLYHWLRKEIKNVVKGTPWDETFSMLSILTN